MQSGWLHEGFRPASDSSKATERMKDNAKFNEGEPGIGVRLTITTRAIPPAAIASLSSGSVPPYGDQLWPPIAWRPMSARG